MDLQDLIEHMARQRAARGPGMGPAIKMKWVLMALGGILVIYVLSASVYTVPTDSAGVVQRFGKYHRTAVPGIHLKLPFGMETAMIVPVQKVQKEEFGFRTLQAGVDSEYLNVDDLNSGRVNQRTLRDLFRNSGERGPVDRKVLQREYVMLTGDLNIIDVQWIVQYKVKDAKKFLFNVRYPVYTIRDASQGVMRQLIGNGSVDEALTIGRIHNENMARDLLQDRLDEYDSGIQVVTVKMQSSNPPQRVRPAFNEVNKALQQKEQRINEARKAYNEAIPMAEGNAKKMIESAHGYAAERVNRAEGDVAKFDKVLAEYLKAPEITKRRMYLETMARVLPQIQDKWIIEQGGADGGILMKLNLDNADN